MKTKYAIFLFLIGVLLNLIGSWLKITHLSFRGINGNIILAVGSIIQSLGLILFIYKMLTNPKVKEFLNK